MSVKVTNRAGKWTCKGPQGHVSKGRTRWGAMVAYAKRRVAGEHPAGKV